MASFLQKYFDNNVDLAYPKTAMKWRTLTSYLAQQKQNLYQNYSENSFLDDIYKIVENPKTSGRLTKLGCEINGLLGLMEKPQTSETLKIAELYLETAIASGSMSAMNIGREMGKILVE